MKFIGKTQKDFVLTLQDMMLLHMDKTSIFPTLKIFGYPKCPENYEHFEVVFDSDMRLDEAKDDVLTISICVDDREEKILSFKNIGFILDRNFAEVILECNQYIKEFEVHYINGFIRFIFECDKSKIHLMESYSEKRSKKFQFIKNYNY